jgi:hypothetical protein
MIGWDLFDNLQLVLLLFFFFFKFNKLLKRFSTSLPITFDLENNEKILNTKQQLHSHFLESIDTTDEKRFFAKRLVEV